MSPGMKNSGMKPQQRRGAVRARRAVPTPRLPRRLSSPRFQSALDALMTLARRPWSSGLVVLMMAITLTLPLLMYWGLDQLQNLSGGWRQAHSLSLYLDKGFATEAGRDLAAQLARNDQVVSTQYLSREEALAEFRRHSGLEAELGALGDNPLPAVIILEPAADFRASQALQDLARQLEALDGVESVSADLGWVTRLDAVLELAGRLLWVWALLLGLVLLLVVYNSIRLEIGQRRAEIQVARLVGASLGYVRRPFLLTGFWYGLGASLLAWALIAVILAYLQGPLQALLRLYGSEFTALGLPGAGLALLLVGGPALGVVGAWLAVRRQIDVLEPG